MAYLKQPVEKVLRVFIIPRLRVGLLLCSNGRLRAFALRLGHRKQFGAAFDDVFGDYVLFALAVIGQIVHDIEHHVFDDRSQASGSRLFVVGTISNRRQRFVGIYKLYKGKLKPYKNNFLFAVSACRLCWNVSTTHICT